MDSADHCIVFNVWCILLNYALSPVKPMLESILDGIVPISEYIHLLILGLMSFYSCLFSAELSSTKMGVRFTGLAATLMMTIGTGLNYWAAQACFPGRSHDIWYKTQVIIFRYRIWEFLALALKQEE